jgi:hypothetical protein
LGLKVEGKGEKKSKRVMRTSKGIFEEYDTNLKTYLREFS